MTALKSTCTVLPPIYGGIERRITVVLPQFCLRSAPSAKNTPKYGHWALRQNPKNSDRWRRSGGWSLKAWSDNPSIGEQNSAAGVLPFGRCDHYGRAKDGYRSY